MPLALRPLHRVINDGVIGNISKEEQLRTCSKQCCLHAGVNILPAPINARARNRCKRHPTVCNRVLNGTR
jgi:hypothetical protein